MTMSQRFEADWLIKENYLGRKSTSEITGTTLLSDLLDWILARALCSGEPWRHRLHFLPLGWPHTLPPILKCFTLSYTEIASHLIMAQL